MLVTEQMRNSHIISSGTMFAQNAQDVPTGQTHAKQIAVTDKGHVDITGASVQPQIT